MTNWIEKEDWQYWINEAMKEAKKSSCLRMHFGSVIVWKNEDLGRGCNKAVYEPCKECMREEKKITPRTRAEYCHAFHAEQYAILDALDEGNDVKNAVLVVAGYNPEKKQENKETVVYNRFTCTLCARMMAAFGIEGVVALTDSGPKYRKMRDVYDEAYAVQEEILEKEKTSGKNMTEEDFNKFVRKRQKK